MSNEEILALAKQGKPDPQSAKNFIFCTQEGVYGIKADMQYAADVMRQCIKEGKQFTWAFIDGESEDEKHVEESRIECFVNRWA